MSSYLQLTTRRMKFKMFLLCIWMFVALFDTTFGLSCLSCTNEVNITNCLGNTAVCDDSSEMCFLDRHVKEDLTAVFTAGCRSQQICYIIAAGVRKRNSLVTCAQCCGFPRPNQNVPPCNAYLCNQNPSVPSVQNECGQCDRVEYPTLCQTFSACRADEVCQLKEFFYRNQVYFQLRCRQKSLCDADLKAYKASHNPVVGKRAAVQVCSACCEGNRCNQGGCQVLVKNQTCYDKAICG
ncbi:uncharacterized protein LOC143045309 [Mytilus galloprovincialis]|uniref:uncharacterized protein LOC143045309 n=1 Tax=Mytilus galloprovincialis TaxID=29158 RepID=UPI003F7B98D6